MGFVRAKGTIKEFLISNALKEHVWDSDYILVDSQFNEILFIS